MTPEEAAKRIAELEAEVKDLESRLKKVSLGEGLPAPPKGGAAGKLVWIPWLIALAVLCLYLYQILAGAGPEVPPPPDCFPEAATPIPSNAKPPPNGILAPVTHEPVEPEPPLPGLLD